MIVSPSCPGCEQLRKRLTELGTIKNYRVVDVSTVEGAELARKLGVQAVPNCVVVETTAEGKRARVCSDDEFKKVYEG